MSESKYYVANEWYRGLSDCVRGVSRLLDNTTHWLAGWDYGYKIRADSREGLNQYLDSIGVKPIGVVKLCCTEPITPPTKMKWYINRQPVEESEVMPWLREHSAMVVHCPPHHGVPAFTGLVRINSEDAGVYIEELAEPGEDDEKLIVR